MKRKFLLLVVSTVLLLSFYACSKEKVQTAELASKAAAEGWKLQCIRS